MRTRSYWFRRKELKTKLSLVYCALVSVFLIVFFFVCWIWGLSFARKNTYYAADQAFSQMADYIDYRMKAQIYDTYSLAYNNVVTDVLSRTETTVTEQLADIRDIQSLYYSKLGEQPYQDLRICLYLAENALNVPLGSGSVRFQSFSGAMETDWYRLMEENDLRILCSGDQYSHDSGTITVYHTISSSTDYTKKVAAVSTQISCENFVSILHSGTTTNGAVCCIYDRFGQPICASNMELLERYRLESEILDSIVASNQTVQIEGCRINSAFLKTAGWTLIQITPNSDVMSLLQSYAALLILCLIGFIAAGVLLNIWISRILTRRLTGLERSIRNYQGREKILLPYVRDGDEIDHLIESYNAMTEKITTLAEENLRVEKRMAQTELALLNAQINPHFLFNTMDIIHLLVNKGETERAAYALSSMSRFYRIGLSSGKQLMTLAQEVHHVRSYLDIQNLRFNNTIDLIVDLPEETQAVLLPRVTLQPIVENAVNHGIRNRTNQSGLIRITAKRETDLVRIQIWDNGVGISPQTLSSLFAEHGGFGLRNVHERLQLHFGMEYGLGVSSIVNEYTKIEITVPVGKEESKNDAENPVGG